MKEKKKRNRERPVSIVEVAGKTPRNAPFVIVNTLCDLFDFLFCTFIVAVDSDFLKVLRDRKNYGKTTGIFSYLLSSRLQLLWKFVGSGCVYDVCAHTHKHV